LVAVRAHQHVFYHRFTILFTDRVGTLDVCTLTHVDVPIAFFTVVDDVVCGCGCRHVVAGKYLIEGILPSSGFTFTAESVLVAVCDPSSAGVEVVSLTVATESVSYLSGVTHAGNLLGVVC
jgi:hypothetical protein